MATSLAYNYDYNNVKQNTIDGGEKRMKVKWSFGFLQNSPLNAKILND